MRMGPQVERAQSVSSHWKIIREAVSRSHRHDFTEGSIPRAVAILAIPMVLEMSMESTFGLVDALFVSRLGKEAAATVGLTESMLVFKDVLRIDSSEATEVRRWAIDALVRAARN